MVRALVCFPPYDNSIYIDVGETDNITTLNNAFYQPPKFPFESLPQIR